jgi:hypothetical protein
MTFHEYRIPESRLAHWQSLGLDAPSLIHDEVHAFARQCGIKATDAEMTIEEGGYLWTWPVPMTSLLIAISSPEQIGSDVNEWLKRRRFESQD